MAGKGQLPKPADQRRRRNATPGFRQLLANAREGKPTPEWPEIADKPGQAEEKIWKKLWSLPQAEEWERMQVEELVALYCKLQAQALTVWPIDLKLTAEMRQLDMKLGISPGSLATLRWEIADPPTDTTNTPSTNGRDSSERPIFR